MSAPTRVNDGDFTQQLQNGSYSIDQPLADKGDYNHLVIRHKVRVDVASFKTSVQLPLSVRNFTTGDGARTFYLVGASPGDIPGAELNEWEISYATLPANRYEYSDFAYTLQYIFRDNDPLSVKVQQIVEFNRTMSARIEYAYFLKGSPLPILLAPRIEEFMTVIYGFGGWRAFAVGEYVVAQDSKIERYIGDMFVRKTISIVWPDIAAGIVAPNGTI